MDVPENPFDQIRRLTEFADPLHLVRAQFERDTLQYASAVERFTRAEEQSLRDLRQFEALQERPPFQKEIDRYTRAIKEMDDFDRKSRDFEAMRRCQGELETNAVARSIVSLQDLAGTRWLDLVRAATVAFDPLEDLRRAAESVTSLSKYAALAAIDPYPFVERSLQLSAQTLHHASRELNDIQRILTSISELSRIHDVFGEHEAAELDEVTDEELEAPSYILLAAGTETLSLSVESMATFAEAIVDAYKASLEKPDRQIFWLRVYPALLVVLGLLLTPVADVYIKKVLPAPATEASQFSPKQVNLTVRALAIPPMLLSGLRYVDVKDTLPVRETARKKARVLGYISRGASLQVLQNQSSWTLVRWTDADQNLLVQGWVLSRYLKKFN